MIDTEFPIESKFDRLPQDRGANGVTAFLTIQEGCDKFCTFCVVPYTRGAEQSRPAAAHLARGSGLVAPGARQVTLLGQNVNAYHGDGDAGGTWDLARLLRELAEIPGLARLRYTTSHPRHGRRSDPRSPRAAATHAVPAPAGAIGLRCRAEAMNRNYTADHYRRVVDELRAARPDLALSSDFIVGFPGETKPTSRPPASGRRYRLRAGIFVQVQRPPGHPGSGLRQQVPEKTEASRCNA